CRPLRFIVRPINQEVVDPVTSLLADAKTTEHFEHLGAVAACRRQVLTERVAVWRSKASIVIADNLGNFSATYQPFLSLRVAQQDVASEEKELSDREMKLVLVTKLQEVSETIAKGRLSEPAIVLPNGAPVLGSLLLAATPATAVPPCVVEHR